jgi:hypothetical protein
LLATIINIIDGLKNRKSMMETIEKWLENVQGMYLFVGIDGGTEQITKQELLDLCAQCEWAEIVSDSRISGIYPETLKIGYGDFLEWCRTGGKSEQSRAYFITAKGDRTGFVKPEEVLGWLQQLSKEALDEI